MTETMHAIAFAAFIAIKVAGTALASWSWFWVLFPEVPLIALALGRLGWL